MKNYLFAIICIFIYSCSSKPSANTRTQNSYTINTNKWHLTIKFDDKHTDHTVKISALNRSYTRRCSKELSVNLKELFNTNDQKYRIALQLIKDNKIPFQIAIGTDIDTTIFIKPLLRSNKSDIYAKAISGTCAKLLERGTGNNYTIAIKKWLYENNKPLPDSLILRMSNIVRELSKTDYAEFETFEEIPVVKNLSGINYRVSTNMKANYYYLFATNTQQELDDFIKDVSVNGFRNAETNTTRPMSCYRVKEKGGALGIFLIGINKNGDRKIVPIGLIAIDNIPPLQQKVDWYLTLPNNNKEVSYEILLHNNTRINIPRNLPEIIGYADIQTTNFGGNGLSCQVNFSLSFGGDIKTATIHRDGNLGAWIGRGKKIIDVEKEESPYLFSYKLHLEDGDNYVPITILDKRGNKKEYKINIPARFTRDNGIDINIENKINIYN